MSNTSDLSAIWSLLQTELDAHRPRERPASVGGSPTPVVLLAGFLGAGKSTLLASLLTDPPEDLTVAAIVNDVGSLPFDPSLVVEGANFEVELSNGCGCCVSTLDLAATLDRLARQGADMLVLEASGIADPLALAQMVEAEPAVELDRIVTVVDAGALEIQLANPALGPIVRRQLAAAHVVVVSKTDGVSASGLAPLTELVASLAPGAPITLSSLAQVSVTPLLPESTRGARPDPIPAAPRHELVSVTVRQVRAVTVAQVESALRSASSAVVRVKGYLAVGGGAVQVQFAGGVGSTSLSENSMSGEPNPAESAITVVATSQEAAAAFADSLGCV